VKYGVNLVRRHPMISELGQSMSAGALDTYDKWFKALKDNGVYTDWSVFYPDNVAVSNSILPGTLDPNFSALLSRAGVTMTDLWNELPSGSGSTKKLGGFDNFVWAYQEGEWLWLKSLLEHTNPYTGMRYVDDPALAVVEVQNEDCIFWHWPLNDLATGTNYPKHTLLLKRMWFEWLQNRYADDAALAAAWGAGLRTGDSVVTFNPNMKIYGAWEMEADGPFSNKNTEKARMGDWIRFLAETQRAHYQARFDKLRALGYQGVVISTAWKAGGPAAAAANLWADDAGDAIDRHAYFGGGAGGHYVATGAVNNGTHLSQPGYGILGGESIDAGGSPVSVFQVEDKPVMMTEWNSNPPNQWRGEMAPLFGFYGMGLQGWDASLHFAGARPWMEGGWPGYGRGPSSYVSETPLYMGQFPAIAFAIYKGHIQQGAAAAARRVSIDDLFRGIDPLSQPLPDGGYPGQNNIYTPPEVAAIGRLSFKADDSYSSSDSTKVDWNAYWDQANKIITSTTGELVWDYNDKVVQVKSAKTQGVIGWAGGKGTYDLPGVQVSVNAGTPFCSLLFTPLDDLPLIDSAHILVTAIAQDKQVGTVYGAGGTQLNELGGPPLLLQPVQASITLKGTSIDSVKVVDVYGVPTSQTVPLSSNTFTINGSYTTFYYEINRAGTPTPTIALSTTALTATCVQGSDPADGSFQVWNSGQDVLNYTVSDDAGWLSVSPSSGTSNDSTDKQTHTVSYSASGLSAGTYNATITITDAAASNDPQTLSVTLTVQAPPSIVLSPTALNRTCTEGANLPDDTFQVWDGGDVALNYTVSDDATWLSVSPSSGTSTGPSDKQTHTVSYTTSGLAVGTYDATITVADPAATNTPQTIAVHVTVQTAPPSISHSPDTLTPTCVRGTSPADQTFDVWNGGSGTLDYTVTDDAAWLSVSPAGGSSTGSGDKVTHTVSYTAAGLAVGTYNGTITIQAAGVPNSPQTIAVQLTVQPAPPAIALSTTSLSPFCAGGQDALSQTFQVWNSGDGTLSYTVSDDAGWLSVSPTGGTSTGAGDKKTHTITYSTGSLAQGTYDATITIADPAAANTPQTIAVHLSVLSEPPAISVSPDSFSPQCMFGEDAAADSIQIWNGGDGTLNYTVYTSVPGGPSWIGIAPGSGSSTGSGDKVTHTITYSTAGLSAGTYDADIVITSAGASNSPRSVPVSLTVLAPTSIGLAPASLSATCAEGVDPADQQFQVWNAAADGTLNYDITDDAAWLSVAPAAGASTGAGDPQTHTVSFSVAGLGVGTHSATITITAAGASNSPQTIDVELTVQDGSPPLVEITWPTELDSPLSDPMITVTGTASDESGIEAIWINGIKATSTGAGFSTWEATIPLNQGWDGSDPNGADTIEACAVDSVGNFIDDADSVDVHCIGDAGLVHRGDMAMQCSGAVVPGDVDTFQFEAAAGTSLKLSAKTKGKPVAPVVRVVVYDPWGSQLKSQTGQKISLASILPSSGLYTVCVSVAAGDGGIYQLKLQGKPPKAKLKVEAILPSASATEDSAMTMPRGSLLKVAVQSKEFQPLLRVLDPIGHIIPIAGLASVADGKVRVKSLPLPTGDEPYMTGDYVLRVLSDDGRDGVFRLTAGAKPPKSVKEKLLYPQLLGTSAKSGVSPGGLLQLKVVGASGNLARNVIYLGGRALAPDDASLKAGKGSLYVNVPADMPAGPAELYFLRVDDEVSEKSNIETIQILP